MVALLESAVNLTSLFVSRTFQLLAIDPRAGLLGPDYADFICLC